MIDLEVAYIKQLDLVITGYRGYVGSNLLSSLNKKVEIIKLISLHNKDIKKVIQLAAKVGDSVSTISNNIQLDTYVIEFCEKNNCQLIYASSNNVYPYAKDCKDIYQLHEADFYGASKIFTEQILEYNTSIKYVSLRIGDVFGKNQKHGNFFKNIQSSIIDKKDLSLYGRGLKVRNYIFIDDLVNVLKFFIKNNISNNETFNIAYQEPVSIFQIVNYISHSTAIPIKKIEYDISKELTDFRTLKFTLPQGFNFNYDIWSALNRYVLSMKDK
jgi:UDP-glucose 4-epimerase